jgi:aspartyl-tRNA synthetase
VSELTRTLASDTVRHIGERVRLQGWIHTRRDHGQLIFLDLRDRSGLVQCVIAKAAGEAYTTAQTLRSEFVVELEGTVAERPEKLRNPKLPTGTVELKLENVRVLNAAKTPPFGIADETEVGEVPRLTYRYLDLRRAKPRANMVLRNAITAFIRNFLQQENFLEIETPYLTKGTPEGAREFIVPSRHQAGKFYTLPQSPQQFKQLLMVAGMERYYQIVRCFRDEDQRRDRQPEFTQLDMEMSFVDEEDVLGLIETLFTKLIETVTPEKHLTFKPFKRLTYAEAMEQYQSDKPDLRKDKDDRNELAFAIITDFPMFEYSETEGKLVPTHHLFTAPKDADRELLATEPEKVKAKQYDLVLNGYEIAGGSIRIHDRDLQHQIFKILKLSDEEIETRFGHMLRAFEYGVPPHGGIAPGLDRLVAVLAGEDSIQEVIAFPKTGDGRDLMMGAPSALPEKQLRDVHIRTDKK